MELHLTNPIKVKLESNANTTEAYKEILEHKNLFEIVPRNEEEEVLLFLAKSGYTWDSTYIYKDNIKICKPNYISQQIIFNPELEPDPIIISGTKGFDYYWKGNEYEKN